MLAALHPIATEQRASRDVSFVPIATETPQQIFLDRHRYFEKASN
jgi:hypothetical protein